MNKNSAPSQRFKNLTGAETFAKTQFQEIQSPFATTEGHQIIANSKYVVIPWKGLGGPFTVKLVDQQGRIPHDTPQYTGHTGPIMDMEFSPFHDDFLATASGDSTIRLWKMPPGGAKLEQSTDKTEAILKGHSKKVMLLQWHPSADGVIASAGQTGGVRIWDVRAEKNIFSFEDNKQEPRSMVWNHSGSLISLFSKDKKIHIIDPRSQSAVHVKDGHLGIKPAKVQWKGLHNLMISVGFSDKGAREYMVHDPRNWAKPLQQENLEKNTSACWSHYDDSTGLFFVTNKGSTEVQLYYFSHTGERKSKPELIPCLNHYNCKDAYTYFYFMPKHVVDVQKKEIIRGIKLSGKLAEFVSFKIARKNETDFSADLYPHHRAQKAALTSEDWAKGANADPIVELFNPEIPREGLLAPTGGSQVAVAASAPSQAAPTKVEEEKVQEPVEKSVEKPVDKPVEKPSSTPPFVKQTSSVKTESKEDKEKKQKELQEKKVQDEIAKLEGMAIQLDSSAVSMLMGVDQAELEAKNKGVIVKAPSMKANEQPKVEQKQPVQNVFQKQIQPKVVAKQEPKPVVKDEPKVIPKEEPKPVVKDEPKVIPKEEPKPFVKEQAKIEVKEEPKPQPTQVSEPKPEPVVEKKIEEEKVEQKVQEPVKAIEKQQEASDDKKELQKIEQEEPKKEEPVKEEPKLEEPKKEEIKKEQPKKEDTQIKMPKIEEPKKEEPKILEPKKEDPKKEESVVDKKEEVQKVIEAPTQPLAQETTAKEVPQKHVESVSSAKTESKPEQNKKVNELSLKPEDDKQAEKKNVLASPRRDAIKIVQSDEPRRSAVKMPAPASTAKVETKQAETESKPLEKQKSLRNQPKPAGANPFGVKLAPPKEIQKDKNSQKDVTTRGSENKFGVKLNQPKVIEKEETTRATMPIPPKKDLSQDIKVATKKQEQPKPEVTSIPKMAPFQPPQSNVTSQQTKQEPKKEEPKKSEPIKKEEPKKVEPIKKEEPKKVEPKKEESKKVEVKAPANPPKVQPPAPPAPKAPVKAPTTTPPPSQQKPVTQTPKVIAAPAPPKSSPPKAQNGPPPPPSPPAPPQLPPSASSLPPSISSSSGGPPAPPPPPGAKLPPPPGPPKGAAPLAAPPALPKGALTPAETQALIQAQASGAAGASSVMPGLAASMAVDPDEAKREELEGNPEFKKILKVLKMGISIMQIRQNMQLQGKFDPDDIVPFCNSDQMMALKKSGTFNEKEYEKKKEKYAKELAKRAPKQVPGAAGGAGPGGVPMGAAPKPPPPPPKIKSAPAPPAPPKNAMAPPALPPGAMTPAEYFAILAGKSGGGGGAAPLQIPVDPEQEKKERLENDPDFKKVLKALKMGVPVLQVRNNIRMQGKFDPDDLLMFCSSDQIMQLKKSGDYKGTKY